MQHERIAVSSATGVKLVVGLFLTALGLLWTIDNLDLAETGAILDYWPGVLIVIGLLKLTDRTARAFSIVMIVVGSLLLLRTTGLLRIGLGDLWPLLLIGAGIVLVLQALGLRGPTMAGDSTVWGVLSTQEMNVHGRPFSGGRAVAFMGTAKVDLTGAELGPGPAVLEVFALMGGVEIYVPDGWHVRTEAIPFMAGIETKARSKIGGRELLVRGFVMMSGVEIKDVTARKA